MFKNYQSIENAKKKIPVLTRDRNETNGPCFYRTNKLKEN